uniref:Partitioning defective 3 homolog n=1 Tax=Cacopsylla melanoneura TaxID=428564 RepID=A0A8D8LHB1_9HEMI
MKVTVCFGPVKVIVPCGDGEILVKDLIRRAITRYKKATGKSGDTWVAVHSLQSQSDGGILDPDDKLNDVADDREQIIANFEDGDGPHHHAGGDGASGSSVGTGSPDIFQDGKYRTDIEVTNEQIASGVPVSLHVRRGSEPALNIPNGISNGHMVGPPPITDVNQSKRWSAAAPSLDDQPPLHRKNELKVSNGYSSSKWGGRYPDEEDELPLRHTFSREGSNRLSMQFLGESPGGFRWTEAMERLNSLPGKTVPVQNGGHKTSFSLPRENKRKEPLGQANSNPPSCATSPGTVLGTDNKSYAKSEFVILVLDHRSLGLHVVPDYDPLGKERGLLITGIEDGSPAAKNGRLALFDRIVEINGRNLLDLSVDRMQEIFRDSLKGHELRLRIVKYLHEPNFRRPTGGGGAFSSTQPPQPVFPHNKENSHTAVMVQAGEERSKENRV